MTELALVKISGSTFVPLSSYDEETAHRWKNGAVIRAESIRWAKMDDEEFSRLYQAVFNVIWERLLSQTFSSPLEMENVVNQLMGYA